jgi:hypothetical protein
MKKFLSALVVALIVTGGVHARIIRHEITPANAERRGWRIEVTSDEDARDLIRFTVWRGDKEQA